MASKRALKKRIYRICGDIANVILCERDSRDNIDKAAANTLVGKIADIQHATIHQCTFSFEKSEKNFSNGKDYHKALNSYRKKAYNKINKEFEANLGAVVKDMNALMPPR